MSRGGRPRLIRERNARGKLRPLRADDDKEPYEIRMRRFGVTARQSRSPMAGYLAGVLFLRRQITADHLGRFISFLQLSPQFGAKAIVIRERVQGGRLITPTFGSKRYGLLVKALGLRMNILHELANDRLICSVDSLRQVLAKVPLTKAGSEFSISCETHRSRTSRHASPSGKSTDAPPQILQSEEMETSVEKSSRK